MLASGHFQDAIEPPRNFDAVIIILESRLGTPMPERFRGIDGRTPVAGTEWEYEDALDGSKRHKDRLPDLLVYRSRRKIQLDPWDAQSRQEILKQIEALDVFWSRHFSDGVKFIGAYSEFESLESFANLARDLADEGMMQPVASAYENACKRPPPTIRELLTSFFDWK
jgi:hypothetical protein